MFDYCFFMKKSAYYFFIGPNLFAKKIYKLPKDRV